MLWITANTTDEGPLKAWLPTVAQAHVLFIAEHKVPLHRIDEFSDSLRKLGWHAALAPALGTGNWLGNREATSAGTGVLTRAHIGQVWHDEDHVLVPGRLVVTYIETDSLGEVATYAIYLVSGVGLNDANTHTLAVLGAHVRAHRRQFVVGGDFNIEPQVLEASGICALFGGVILWPKDAEGNILITCTSGEGHTLDYFVVSDAIAQVDSKCGRSSVSLLRPH